MTLPAFNTTPDVEPTSDLPETDSFQQFICFLARAQSLARKYDSAIGLAA